MDESTQNSMPVTGAPIEPNIEQVEQTDDALYSDMSPEEFSSAIDKNLLRMSKYEGEIKLKKRQSTNKMYYEGDQLDVTSLRDDQEKWVENAILRNIETFVPIATSRIPELSTTPAYKNEKTRSYSGDVRRILQTEWETLQTMQPKLSKGIRNHQKNLVAVFQLGYDPETGSIWTEEIPATEIKISKHKDFLIKYVKNKTLGDLFDMFPDKVKEIKQYYGWGDSIEITKQMRSSPCEYIEAWNHKVVGYRLGTNLVLGLDKNPHWDYKGQEFSTGQPQIDPDTGQPAIDPATGQPLQPQSTKVFFNHLKTIKWPFIFLYHINTTGHAYDDTTILEQSIGLQNWINKRKRQIGENADAANGVWVTSGDFISQEEFDKIEGGINEKIWLENGIPANGIARITGNSLEDFVYNDLIDSRKALNELMGINAATLGTQTDNDTLGKDVMDRQQSMGRIDGYVRDGIERFAQEWYEYMYHLYLVYKTDETSIAIPEDDDMESDNIIFSREAVPVIQKKDGTMIPVPLILRVRQGSTLPQDEVMEYNRAQQNKDIMAPVDYFKKIGEANPRELAKNALINSMDPTWFFKEDPDIIELTNAMAQKAQMAASQADAQANAGKQPPAPSMDQRDAQANGESTPEGVAKAMRSQMNQQGQAN